MGFRFKRSCVFVSLILSWGVVTALAQDAPDNAEISKFIEQLGDDDFQIREKAEERLIDTGIDAIAALQEAAKVDDAEVSFRAKRAIKQIMSLVPGELKRLRDRAKSALRVGDYKEMVRIYRRLINAPNSSIDDQKWLGHACQLSGNWERAADTYLGLIDYTDRQLDTNPGHSPEDRNNLVLQRVALILLVSRIQRHFLNDAEAAERTLRRVRHYIEVFDEPLGDIKAKWINRIQEAVDSDRFVDSALRDVRLSVSLHVPMMALRELAAVQELNGNVTDALKTWNRIHLITRCYVGHADSIDIPSVDRLVEQLPDDSDFELPAVTVLGPEDLTAEFDLHEPESLAKANAIYQNYWTFGLAPPPGHEFKSLEFDCDIEQLKQRYGGQFSSWAYIGEHRLGLSHLTWPHDKALGRDIITTRIDIKPGTGLVQFKTGTWKDKFVVHHIKVTAEVRKKNKDAAEVEGPIPGFYFHTECLPIGGALTLNGVKHPNDSTSHNVKPGRHTLSYKHPDHEESQSITLDLESGARYGMFINLESPLRPQLSDLRGFKSQYGPSNNVVQMADGKWLIAWGDDALHFATSPDLINWTKSWTMDEAGLFGEYFKCMLPSLYVDKEGTIWMAYFSNRLAVDQLNTGGFQLFLTKSKDGKDWSSPRPIVHPTGGWPPTNVHMFTGPDNKVWMLYRLMYAKVDRLDQELKFKDLPITVTKTQRSHARNAHATVDENGQIHLVWDHFKQALHYAKRDEKGEWGEAVPINTTGQANGVSHPQLFINDDRLALVYVHQGAVLRRGSFKDGLPVFGQPIKVTHHVSKLISAHRRKAEHDSITLLCGSDTVWLQEASIDDVLENQD